VSRDRAWSLLRGVLVAFDRVTLAGIAAGLALELQPFWSDGLRVGFAVTCAAVVLQIASSHVLTSLARE